MRVLTLLAFLAACSPTPPRPPSPLPDAGRPPSCDDACSRLEQLGCDGALPTREGHSCVEVCENVQDSGFLAWNLGCRAAASSCAAVDACK